MSYQDEVKSNLGFEGKTCYTAVKMQKKKKSTILYVTLLVYFTDENSFIFITFNNKKLAVLEDFCNIFCCPVGHVAFI